MHKKIFPFFSLFLIIFLSVILFVITTIPKKTTILKSHASERDNGQPSLEPYCQSGYYNIPGESKCSRAPGCGGYTYDQVNTMAMMPNKDCLSRVVLNNPKSDACDGYPPACCYEAVRTGDFTKCVGYWERLWCSPDLCEAAEKNGASDDQCGGCLCGHAYGIWCAQRGPLNKAVPIEVRLGMAVPQPTIEQSVPSATPTPPSTGEPTETPTPITELPTPTSIPERALQKNPFTIPDRQQAGENSDSFSLTLPVFPNEKVREVISPIFDFFASVFTTINMYDKKFETAVNNQIERINPFK